MKRTMTLLASLLAALCALAAVPAVAAAPPAELAARVQQRYQTIHSLRADYLRLSRFVAGGGQSARQVRASGRLVWQRPLSLRMEQDKPRRELVVTTPQGVWWARPQRRRADLYPLKQFTTGLQSLLDALGGLAKVDQAFHLVKPTPADLPPDSGLVLVLSPKERRADLKRLVVWFDAQKLTLKGFRIVSLVGDVTEYHLHDLKVNPELPAGTFRYTPPPDFKVRDHRPR